MKSSEQTSLLSNNNKRASSKRSSQQQQVRLSITQQSLRDIERISQNAHRLAQEVNDTDSVNGLLGCDDDYSVGSGIAEMFDDDYDHDVGAGSNTRGSVTQSELDFLSGKRPSSSREEDDEETSRNAMLVDRVGESLLQADDETGVSRILRKSLRLDASRSTFDLENEPSASTITRQVSDRVHESTKALKSTMLTSSQRGSRAALLEMMQEEPDEEKDKKIPYYSHPTRLQILRLFALSALILLILYTTLQLSTRAIGPPRLPIGSYKIVEVQVGSELFSYYDFYSGKDSAGSNGYNLYVSREVAESEGIVKVVKEEVGVENMVEIYDDSGRQEVDWLLEDLEFLEERKRKKVDEIREESVEIEDKKKMEEEEDNKKSIVGKNETTGAKKSTARKAVNGTRHLQSTATRLEAFNPDPPVNGTETANNNTVTETFVYLSSSSSPEGPRNSIRLEGRRRFNRGLFIIDLRHMPAGCGTWPAFWLTDEANWPVNGEIDIVEGVNYQDTAKTALHTTKECRMDDVPEGSKTGTWDTAVGIPDKKTGIPDMTFRYAEDCFVYDPHQWINQGCVATDLKLEGRSLGVPLNNNGGGVFALEWDPTNTHIRTWVFSPHGRVPKNLRDAMRTAQNVDESTRVAPDTTKWGLPYGHFPIGDGTNCPAEHFRNMRLVINLAFCGSVAGTRYFMDCPRQFKKIKTCEKWVASDPDELKEAYWKIRGIYVYEREWQKQWV